MTSHHIRRAIALLVSASLLASLAAATVASPASAAKPKCFGKPATIVGTAKGEVIVGTAKADVIVALGGHDQVYGKGGNDTICGNAGHDIIYGGRGSDLIIGQVGHDQLHGGPGPDRIAGGPGEDRLTGGIGVDLCVQGTGSGPKATCERPPATVAPISPPAPALPPDRDGDGIIDAVDACPDQGDRGWGVDASGCPNPPVTITYSMLGAGIWSTSVAWSGLEPGSELTIVYTYATGGTYISPMQELNGTGSGGPEVLFEAECPTSLMSVTITATEAGGTQQQYDGALPDSSICP